jgi:dCTP deaminase
VPELVSVGGENVINLSNKEAMARALGMPYGTQDEFNALYSRYIDQLAEQETELDVNTFPVLTQDNQFVLSQGVFSDRELRVALEIGHIVCDPAPNAEHGARINGSSIDVSLGYNFYHAGKQDGTGIFNPYSRDDTLRYFGIDDVETDYKEAKPWEEVQAKLVRQIGQEGLKALRADVDYLENIPKDHPMILLRPNERILAHTHEFIGIRPAGTTSMQARSTTGRIGLSACYCAGWGDPGYINRWTMEIHNLNENEYLPVPVGYRIAQLVFSMTGPVGTEYARATGNYQQQLATGSRDIEALKQAWRPSMMLPQANKSEMVLPAEIVGLAKGIK